MADIYLDLAVNTEVVKDRIDKQIIQLSSTLKPIQLKFSYDLEGLNNIRKTIEEFKKSIESISTNANNIKLPTIKQMMGEGSIKATQKNIQTSYENLLSSYNISELKGADQLKLKYSELLTAVQTLRNNRDSATQDEVKNVQRLQAEMQDLIAKMGEAAARAKGISKSMPKEKTVEANLSRYQSLMNQVDTASTWTMSQKGVTSSSYSAVVDYGNKLRDLKTRYDSGLLSAKDFNARVKELGIDIANNTRIIKDAGENTQTFGDKLRAAFGKYAQYFDVSRIIMAAYRTLKQAVSASIELDSAFTQLKIVTGATNEEMSAFVDTTAELAQELGQSVTAVAASIETFSRLGYSLPDASQLAKYATIMANVAGVTNEEATTGITSIIKGYQKDVDDTEHVADVLVNVGQKYAVSASELMIAFEKSGAALNATNTEFEKSAALIAAANASVQNANTVGTALKTVSARIRGSKSELEELGEDTSDLAKGVSKYADEIQALTGFSILEDGTTDQFKDLYDIFEGIAEVWDKLSDTQQARVAEILGGTRQLQVIASILTNWKDATEAYATAMDSAGASTKANETYMESAQARINQLKASFETFSYSVLNSNVIGWFAKVGAGVLSLMAKFKNLTVVLTSIAGIKMLKKWTMFDSLLSSVKNILPSLNNLKTRLIAFGQVYKSANPAELTNAIKALNTQQLLAIASSKKFTAAQLSELLAQKGLNEEEIEAILIKAGYNAETATGTAINLGFTESLKGVAAGIWATTKAFLASPLGILTIVAVGIMAVVKAVDYFSKSTERAVESLNDVKEAYNSTIDEISSIQNELDETGNKIDELNGKPHLTLTEASEIQRLKTQNAELQRRLDILKQTKKEEEQKRNKEFVGLMSSEDESVLYDPNVSYSSNVGQLEDWILQYKSYMSYLTNSDISESDRKTIEASVEELLSNLRARIGEYQEWADGISYIPNPSTDEEKAVNKYLNLIGDLEDKLAIATNGENAKVDAFNRLVTTEFSESVAELMQLGEQGEVTAESLNNDKYQEFIDKCIELGIISDDSEESLAFLALGFNIFDEAITQSTEKVSTFESQLSKLKNVGDDLDVLGKIYEDVSNGEDFDWSSIIDNEGFKEAFGSLGDEYDNFIQTVVNNSGDISACQDAFDDLTDAYLKQSGILNNLTEENKQATIALLEQKGVTNAVEVVDAALTVQKEKLRMATLLGVDATVDSIREQMTLANTSDVTREALFRLYLEKLNIQNPMDLSQNISQIMDLANAAGVGAVYLAKCARAQELLDKKKSYESMGLSDPNSALGSAASALGINLMDDINAELDKLTQEIANPTFTGITTASIPVSHYSGGGGSSSKSSGSSGSGSSKKEDTWFDKAYKKHNHLVNMDKETEAKYLDWLEDAYKKAYDEQIITLDDYYKYEEEVYKGRKKLAEESTKDSWFEKQYKKYNHLLKMDKMDEKDYINWLNNAYKQAYKEGLISLDDYRKYQEEVFNGLRDIFKDYMNDVDHEITARKRFDGESKTIIKLYKKLIKDIKKQIDKARKQGLSDDDDYIQELQSKLFGYEDDLEKYIDDIKNNAEDAVENLIEFRIKMLKKDLENQKDGLKKELDEFKKFCDKRKEELRDAYDEEKYLEEQAEKRKAVSDIEAQLNQLSLDDSAWAQKRKLELAQELADAQKELGDFERDHALELAEDTIDKEYELQEEKYNAELERLEQQLSDERTLYQQALSDIRNGTQALYDEMIKWNREFGDGNDNTVKKYWEDAYVALTTYYDTFDKKYKNINIVNATGYKPKTGSYDNSSISDKGTNVKPSDVKNKEKPADTSSNNKSSGSSNSKPSNSKSSNNGSSSKVNVPDSVKNNVAKAIWNGTMGWGNNPERAKRLEEVFGKNNGIQDIVNKLDPNKISKPSDTYTYANMKKKYKAGVPYKSGTSKAVPGFHLIDENGTETIFESRDGNKYKMFTGGEKVLNATASKFLYEFANNGSAVISGLLSELLRNDAFGKIGGSAIVNNITMSPITINGNADSQTVSQMRRAQRESVEMMLKEFTKLSK